MKKETENKNKSPCATSTPCQGFSNSVVSLLKDVLLSSAIKNGGSLPVEEIERIINNITSAPGDFPKLYETNFRQCMTNVEKISKDRSNSQNNFEEKFIKRAGQLPKEQSLGYIKALGINKLKSKLGNQWKKLSKKFYDMVEDCIRKDLSPKDTFTRINNEFLISYDGLSKEETLLKVQSIEKDISSNLLEENTKHSFDEFNLDAIQWLEIKETNSEAHDIKVTDKDIQGKNLESKLLAKMHKARKKMLDNSSDILDRAFENCKVQLRPVMNVKDTETNISVMEFDIDTVSCLEQLISQPANKIKNIAKIDRMNLILASKYIYTKHNVLDSTISITVNYETIDNPEYLSKYLEICNSLSEDIRQKISFTLKVSHSQMGNYILDKFSVLSPFCNYRALYIEDTDISNLDLRFSGISTVVINYDNLLVSLKTNINAMKDLSKHVHRFNGSIFIDQIPRNKDIKKFYNYAIDYFAFSLI